MIQQLSRIEGALESANAADVRKRSQVEPIKWQAGLFVCSWSFLNFARFSAPNNRSASSFRTDGLIFYFFKCDVPLSAGELISPLMQV